MSQSPILRKCVACKKVLDRKYLLKVTRDFQNGVVLSGGMGRSAYLCQTESCFEEALKLHLAIGERLSAINKLNRATKLGKKAAVNLCAYTGHGEAMTVTEGKLS